MVEVDESLLLPGVGLMVCVAELCLDGGKFMVGGGIVGCGQGVVLLWIVDVVELVRGAHLLLI